MVHMLQAIDEMLERQQRIEMQYIGAVSLLGRVSHVLTDEERDFVFAAMQDLLEVMPRRFTIVRGYNKLTLQPIIKEVKYERKGSTTNSSQG